MYMRGFLFVLGITLLMCLALLIVEWIITHAGVGLFSIVLVTVAVTALMGNGEKRNGK